MKGRSPWNLSSRFVQLSVRRGANLVATPIGASSSLDAVNAERLTKNEYDLVLIATRLWH
jgi:hypothetical protein